MPLICILKERVYSPGFIELFGLQKNIRVRAKLHDQAFHYWFNYSTIHFKCCDRVTCVLSRSGEMVLEGFFSNKAVDPTAIHYRAKPNAVSTWIEACVARKFNFHHFSSFILIRRAAALGYSFADSFHFFANFAHEREIARVP